MKLQNFLLSCVFAGPLLSPLAVAAASGDAAPMPPEPVEQIHLRSNELPIVSLTPELLYRLMVAEFVYRSRRFPGRYQGPLDFVRRLAALGPGFWNGLFR